MRENFNRGRSSPGGTTTRAGARRSRSKCRTIDALPRSAVSVAGGNSSARAKCPHGAPPLMARPSAPPSSIRRPVRAARRRQNQTDQPIRLTWRARDQRGLTAGAGRRVTVPRTHPSRCACPRRPKGGTARFRRRRLGRWRTRRNKLPVWTPATTEAFATYGEIDDAQSMIQPVKAPRTSSSSSAHRPNQQLLDAGYSADGRRALPDGLPVRCSKQLSSRVLASRRSRRC